MKQTPPSPANPLLSLGRSLLPRSPARSLLPQSPVHSRLSRRSLLKGIAHRAPPLALGMALGGMVTPRALGVASAYAQSTTQEDGPAWRVRESDLQMGNRQSPVHVIEFASLTCPHCASFHKDVLPTIKEKYIDTNKIAYAFRSFPLDRVALQAEVLVACADPKVRLTFYELLLAQQGIWVVDPNVNLPRMAQLVNLTTEDLEACFADQALLDGIIRERQEGVNVFKVASTPSIYVNGALAKATVAGVSDAIDDALA
ncbi:MAG: DsbA family protein [Alphaproteobacteria bacterium]|nr:DsbA family protein [Alphaproteobacteria bacterium]